MTEIEVANMISAHMLEMGAEKNSFDPIVASGINSSSPHHHPTNKKIEDADIVTVDIGCIYNGYCSDITRTFIFIACINGFLSMHNMLWYISAYTITLQLCSILAILRYRTCR